MALRTAAAACCPLLRQVQARELATAASTVLPAGDSVAKAGPEAFVNGTNAAVLEDLYLNWLEDPTTVSPSLDRFFRGVEAAVPMGHAFPWERAASVPDMLSTAATAATVDEKALHDTTRALILIRSYRVFGHLNAQLDPLGLMKRSEYPELNPAFYGFSEKDMERKVYFGDHLPGKHGWFKLGEVMQLMRDVYCGHVGIEYMHIQDPGMKQWLQTKVELGPSLPRNSYGMRKEDKVMFLKRLIEAQGLEKFLAEEFQTQKRFGIEGCESSMVALEEIIEAASRGGVESTVIGMPHRGRLNVLGTIMEKPLESILYGFNPNPDIELQGTGDVKYHLGTTSVRRCNSGKKMALSLAANPSHLEAVNPIVLGKTRAKQYYGNDSDRKKTMAVLLHGDAAFAGQGVVTETLQMAALDGYSTGGTIHLIVNNQIGFTTTPSDSRTTSYSSDVAKGMQVPVLHVNGDDPDAVAYACRLAVEWRQMWGKDIVIDVYGYRRYGHNETDQPSFTQPVMYEVIKKHKTTLQLYSEQLIKEGVVTSDEVDSLHQQYYDHCKAAKVKAATYVPPKDEWFESYWEHFKSRYTSTDVSLGSTAVDADTLRELGKKVTTYPETFKPHKTIKKVIGRRAKSFETGQGINWAGAEALAFASLLNEDYPVRLSGQDTVRGTFSHRHSSIFDQETNGAHCFFQDFQGSVPGRQMFKACNSSLSEFAVLGFDLGFSLTSPSSLVLWEAQFGDFANGAQIIIDQFLASGESKWNRSSGLVLLLPHGYEGQGPEHSSARLERFLQLIDEPADVMPTNTRGDHRPLNQINMFVANASTPAQYFHVLRRQIQADFRKPLILMTPKSLLNHRDCVSTLEDMSGDTVFKWVIDDPYPQLTEPSNVRRVNLCSGRVYYDLNEHRTKHELNDIALVRVEQLAPFPFYAVREIREKYPNAEFCWVQEEHQNAGAWQHVDRRIETACGDGTRPRYIGRKPSASTATGSFHQHNKELAALKEAAFAPAL